MTKELTPLEALERVKNAPTIYVGLASDVYTRYSFECKIIEKSIKALEIIKKKNVDTVALTRCFLASWRNIEKATDMYNEISVDTKIAYCKQKKKLTKKEYSLLKEALL